MDKIEVFKAIARECLKHPYDCRECIFYDYNTCIIEDTPYSWNVERIEQALAEMEKEK